jgi:glycine cleavage system H lipoate-binding protein/ABC-type phosphate transport system substrate-binding protein
MKRAVYILIGLMLILCNNLYSRHSGGENNPDQGASLNVLATPDLYNLAMKWASEYKRLFPEVNIKIINVATKEKAGDLIKEGIIGFVSNEFYAELNNESLWKVVIGRDVIVPVINAKNPFLEEIDLHGISPDVLSSFLKNNGSRNWGDLLKNGKNVRADYFCIGDATTIKSLAGFLKTEESKIGGKDPGNVSEVISAIQKDPYAIGFCKLINVLDFENQRMVENIRLLPIDRNSNGAIDSNEKIYDDINSFSRGVWIGKYPKALFSNIYTVAKGEPENISEVAFLKWVLSDGQKYLSGNGYSDLLVSERQSTSDKLDNAKVYTGASADETYLLKSLLFIIATVILISLIVTSLARQRKRKKASVRISGSPVHPVLDESSLMIPKGIYYDKTHTWAYLEANGNVKIGIDDFLQHITGKITRIKMKSPGKKVKKGEQILSIIQNGKQLNLYAPISGTIIEQNMVLDTNSSSLNSSPYNDGWIYRIEPLNWSRESQLLFMADKQKEFIKKEFSRLKDFLMTALASDEKKYAQVLLQDGGEISDAVLSDMGPEIWEDFQTNFIDPSRQVWFYEMF